MEQMGRNMKINEKVTISRKKITQTFRAQDTHFSFGEDLYSSHAPCKGFGLLFNVRFSLQSHFEDRLNKFISITKFETVSEQLNREGHQPLSTNVE